MLKQSLSGTEKMAPDGDTAWEEERKGLVTVWVKYIQLPSDGKPYEIIKVFCGAYNIYTSKMHGDRSTEAQRELEPPSEKVPSTHKVYNVTSRQSLMS